MEITGTVAVVTGGGSGIGRALATALAAAGARVVVGDVDDAGAQETATRIREAGGSVVAVRADASSTSGIEALRDAAAGEFGPVDIYVANAGIIGATGLGTEGDWDRILDINLRAHIRAAEIRGAGMDLAR